MKKLLILVLGIVVLLNLVGGVSAYENLDEMENRVARQASASWGSQYMEDASNHYIWQPETLMYEDTSFGSEVWRLSPSANFANSFPDIGFPQWSADGKRIVFTSYRNTEAFDSSYELYPYGTRMIVSSDGSDLRPMPDAPARTSVDGSGYTIWSPVVPDVYYMFGRSINGEGLNPYDLYKVTSSDTSDSKELLLPFPNSAGTLRIKKGISGDGTKIFATGYSGIEWFFPATVYPDSAVALDDPNGYSADTNDLPYDEYWGDLKNRINYLHDQYLAGAGDNTWFYFIPENTTTWLRMRLTGSGVDGMPAHIQDHEYPYDWGGEFEILNTGAGYYSSENDPWCFFPDAQPPGIECGTYFSHFVPDRWGRIVAYSNGEGEPEMGPGTYDMDNNLRVVYSFGGGGAQHHDWHAWSDWFASSGAFPYETQEIWSQKYDEADSQISLATAHVVYTGDFYGGLARPTQSPDGTKITWHSGFLNTDREGAPDLFYVVAYYPYPPEITSVNANAGIVTARFDWRLNTANPRGYTERGWPNETTDIPPAPREVEKFRLWRSPDGNTWTPLNTVDHNIFDRFDFVNGGFTGQDYWTITDNPGDGTWYYAVTSIETSKLESRSLSNIYQVTVNGGSGSGVQSVAYPTNPGEKNIFYTTEPSAPSNLNYIATGTPGHYQLDWIEPFDNLVRYYNIYYSTTPTPAPIQQNRIASVPKGTSEYLDWNADQGLTGYYTITSVDSQGNEGALTEVSQYESCEEAVAAGATQGKPCQEVSACIDLNIAGRYYLFVDNITSPNGACFSLLADNIVLDGNGYQIDYATFGNGNVLNVLGVRSNFEMKKLKVIQGVFGGSAFRDYQQRMDRLSIHDCNFTIHNSDVSNAEYAIYADGVPSLTNIEIYNNYISMNAIDTSQRRVNGIGFNGGVFQGEIYNNTIFMGDRIYQGRSSGISIEGGAFTAGVNISNNVIFMNQLDQGEGIRFWDSGYNVVFNNTIYMNCNDCRGILVDANCDYNDISYNTIWFNIKFIDGMGIRVRYDADFNEIHHNHLEAVGPGGSPTGLTVGEQTPGIAEGNIFHHNYYKGHGVGSQAYYISINTLFYCNRYDITSPNYVYQIKGDNLITNLNFQNEISTGGGSDKVWFEDLYGTVADPVIFCNATFGASEVNRGVEGIDYIFTSGPCANSCNFVSSSLSLDVNSDGNINIIDLAIVIFNQGRNPIGDYSHLDLNEDGAINWDDVRSVMVEM